jgi:hypothetical protein
MLTHTLDHPARAIARLTEHRKIVPDLVDWLNAFNVETQEIEDVLWDIYTKRLLSGEGAQLDQLGRILAEPRSGFGDPDYLERLKAKILVLRSSGGPLDLIRIYKTLLPNNSIKFTQLGGAGFILDIGIINPDFIPIYQRFLHYAKSAGINAQLLYTESILGDTFCCDIGSTFAYNASAGATTIEMTSGASFAAGDLVAIDPGLTVSATIFRVLTGVSTVYISFTTGIPISKNEGTSVSVLARTGGYALLTTATVGAAVDLAFAAGHPFSVGDEITLDPMTDHAEHRIVTVITDTLVTLSAPLAYSHALAAPVCRRIFQGWGSLTDDREGGKLSGTIV